MDKSIYLIEKKGYATNILSHKYTKVKVLALSNKLNKSELLISELLNSISKTDGRKPYFLAQKALIKAKKKQKDSAIYYFYKAVSLVHKDTLQLANDFSNFKPSTTFGDSSLLLRIAEELNTYFSKDTVAKKLNAALYTMAFLQFENSYDKRKFNAVQKKYLRQIFMGILNTKKIGYHKNINSIDILDRFETIQNLLAWQKFNQNRQIHNFPKLDSLLARNYNLRSLITKAKSKKATIAEDSIQTLLLQTVKFTKETYPNLNLFTNTKFKIDSLRSKLTKNQLVIKYIVFDNQMAIYTISKHNVNVIVKPWSTSDNETIITFINQLKNKKLNTEIAAVIANKILPDFEKNTKHLIINSDEILNKLAFETLVKNGTSLLNQYTVSYTANLGFIFPEVCREVHENTLAVYAP